MVRYKIECSTKGNASMASNVGMKCVVIIVHFERLCVYISVYINVVVFMLNCFVAFVDKRLGCISICQHMYNNATHETGFFCLLRQHVSGLKSACQ